MLKHVFFNVFVVVCFFLLLKHAIQIKSMLRFSLANCVELFSVCIIEYFPCSSLHYVSVLILTQTVTPTVN